MNRGSMHKYDKSIKDDIASMRPRFMNRGSARRRRRRPRRTGRFNEAPIHESGKSCTRRRSKRWN